MRVFIVSPGSKPGRIPPISGGIEAYEYNLSRKLVSLGHEVHIMRRWFPDMPLEEKVEGIHIHRIRSSEKSERLSFVTYSLRVAKKLSSLIRGKNDVIHCHERTSGMGIFLIRIHKRAPVIYSFHTADALVASRPYFDNWLLYRANLWADGYMIKHSDRVFAISEAIRQNIISKVRVPPEKVVTTPNSVDTNRLKPGDPDPSVKKRLSVGDDPLILFVGKLNPAKGINHLIQALPLVQKEVSSVKLVIVGKTKKESDAYGHYLKNLTQDLGKSVIFTGEIPFQNLCEVYKACDVFVSPSLYEVMPTVVIEAMAFAKPVVATNIPGTNEVVRDGKTGILVELGDIRNLADALITILKDEEMAKRMGKNGRDVVETSFNWDKNIETITREYEEILSNRN